MVTDSRVLVVGTTADYIDWIRKSRPGSALFLTEERIRRTSSEPVPAPDEEVLYKLTEINNAPHLLREHTRRWKIQLEGVACYDCESLSAASRLAEEFDLAFPSPEVIANCRSKYQSKALWKKHGVNCSDFQLISSAEAAWSFAKEHSNSCVLKPVFGSGSELTFRCHSQEDCDNAFDHFYAGGQQGKTPVDSHNDLKKEIVLVESVIDGKEYSCDCLINNGRAELIRLTAKLSTPAAPFGTTLGYTLISPPEELATSHFLDQLVTAAAALGIHHAICMVDFIVAGTDIYFLEVTPRIGGDCLPHLIRSVHGIDMLALALDFARGDSAAARQRIDTCNFGVGLRIFAHKEGNLHGVDTNNLKNDPRVLEINITRKAGHKIILPPEDYDSWLLGYVIFVPGAGTGTKHQCMEILQSIHMDI
ncbi:MAG: ATP-grasp domain-containing protein, partial [Desulfocapsaceae bacterium]|nr:ATP-grasp domain-containing protein [Desulfocapsaceae bacterium]